MNWPLFLVGVAIIFCGFGVGFVFAVLLCALRML